MSAVEGVVGAVLTRVEYIHVHDTVWQPGPGFHQLDFGLVLTFAADVRLGLIWDRAGHLAAVEGGLDQELIGPVATTDVSGIPPWRERIGSPLTAARSGWPGARADEHGCAVRLSFGDGAEAVWVVTATVLWEPLAVLPCGDEVLVLTDRQLATLEVAHTVQSSDGSRAQAR